MSAALLFVADPLSSFKIYKDTTFAMMLEAQLRGLQLWACEPQDLQILQGKVSVHARHIALTGEDSEWYTIQAEETVEVTRFAAVIMRKDPPFDMEYLYSSKV
jgi:glutathione synthase